MITNRVEGGSIHSRYNDQARRIETNVDMVEPIGWVEFSMTPLQALQLAQTLLRLVDAHNVDMCERTVVDVRNIETDHEINALLRSHGFNLPPYPGA